MRAIIVSAVHQNFSTLFPDRVSPLALHFFDLDQDLLLPGWSLVRPSPEFVPG